MRRIPFSTQVAATFVAILALQLLPLSALLAQQTGSPPTGNSQTGAKLSGTGQSKSSQSGPKESGAAQSAAQSTPKPQRTTEVKRGETSAATPVEKIRASLGRWLPGGQIAQQNDQAAAEHAAAKKVNDDPKATSVSLPNVKMPTLGGVQFWTDRHWRCGWRIQQNAMTGHFRLIDPDNMRHAWGNRVACSQALERLHPGIQFDEKRIVLLIHGLGRSSGSMHGIAKAIAAKTNYRTGVFEYASTRASIAEHAAALKEVIADLPDDKKISFVCHSMGNIVVRHAVGDWQRAGDQATLARIDSMVMLGPPNQGASIARQLAKTGVFGMITGKGGMELGPEWHALEKRLAIPPFPFAIVAGRLSDYSVPNPLVDGAGDFVVSVEEAKLDGASSFVEVPRMHSFLMDDPKVQELAIEFLEKHRLEPQ